MSIPDAAVEAAARAIWFAGRDGQEWLPGEDPLCDMVTEEARAALESAAPHLMAEAWDECLASDTAWINPYRSAGAGE